MEEFKKEQLRLEYEHLKSKYLGKIEIISSKTKEHCVEYEILLNGVPYIAYMNMLLREQTFIPKVKKLLAGDFDNVYNIRYGDNCIEGFEVYNKKNGVINKISYLFSLNYEDRDRYTRVVLNNETVEDNDNNLYKKYKSSKQSLESFMAGRPTFNLGTQIEEKTVEIRKPADGCSQVCTFPSLAELLVCYVSELEEDGKYEINYQDIDGDMFLVEMAENIIKNNNYNHQK